MEIMTTTRAWWPARLVIVADVVMMLTACGGMGASTPAAAVMAQPSERAATTTPTASPTATLTQTPSATRTASPTAGPSPTATSTPSLPMSVGKDFYLGDLFFDKTDLQDCMLPCWQGLTIGQSKSETVERRLKSVFGFSDFSSTVPLLGANGVHDLYSRGYRWEIDGQSTGYFDFVAGLSENTGTLEALGFHWETPDSSSFEVHMSPQRVIQELGAPAHLLASVEVLMGADWGIVTLMLIYDQGMVFQFITEEEFSGYFWCHI